MSLAVWKSFEDNLLTHSAAHYLMAIHELRQAHGYARVTDIARRLNITCGSCSLSLRPLKKRGLIVEDENRFLALSPEGERLARIVEKNDQMLETFFRELLGVSPEQAEIDACKIEHLLSIESSCNLCALIEFLKSGHASVKPFLQAFRDQTPPCPTRPGECPVCARDGKTCAEKTVATQRE